MEVKYIKRYVFVYIRFYDILGRKCKFYLKVNNIFYWYVCIREENI